MIQFTEIDAVAPEPQRDEPSATPAADEAAERAATPKGEDSILNDIVASFEQDSPID